VEGKEGEREEGRGKREEGRWRKGGRKGERKEVEKEGARKGGKEEGRNVEILIPRQETRVRTKSSACSWNTVLGSAQSEGLVQLERSSSWVVSGFTTSGTKV
jgi:hypothetical protein